MARTFKVYNGTEVIKEGASPLALTGLTASTNYNLKISAVEDGKESEKVDVPEFTTKAPVVAVTSVELTPATVSVEIGSKTQLTATVKPAGATHKNVTYSSSDDTKATVSATGEVTGVAEGTATITVTTEDGNKTATSTVTVTVPVPAE